jgi:protoporphyrinogen/coproporphyrinogen III oxidase
LSEAPVLVVGAGISGLCAAFELLRRGRTPLVVEASARAGGYVRTTSIEGFLFEDGPNTIPGGDGPFRELLADLDLLDDVVEGAPEARRRYFVKDGRWVAAPSGPWSFLTSPLLSFGEKLRVLSERKTRPRLAAATEAEEETLFAFTARRFGRGVADKLLDAIAAGVNGGDPKRLGAASAFPELVATEAKYGSILRGLSEKRKATPEGTPAVISLRGGLGVLPDALIRAIGVGRFRMKTRLSALRRSASGVGYDATLVGPSGATILRVDRAILAVPPQEAAALLAAIAPAAAARLLATPSASMVVVQTGFRRDAVPTLPSGFGALVPRREKLATLGWLLPSDVFPERAPEGRVAATAFRGGAFEPDVCDADDASLVATACEELGATIGLKRPPTPIVARVVRHPRALPLAHVGHAQRMAEAVAALAANAPGISIVGAALSGGAIPKCVAYSRAVAARSAS